MFLNISTGLITVYVTVPALASTITNKITFFDILQDLEHTFSHSHHPPKGLLLAKRH